MCMYSTHVCLIYIFAYGNVCMWVCVCVFVCGVCVCG